MWSKQKVEDTLKFGELEFNKTKQGWVISTKQYLKDRKGIVRKTKAFSLIGDIYTEHGTEEIITLLGNGRIFPYPKPSIFIERLLEIGSDKNDLILDFFAGSGTTAHAVMAQNTKDGGNRKFILVQLPEPTSPDSEAYKAGYKTIADITKERARRVIKGYGDNPKPINNGFKVFKLAPSNYPDISYEFDPSKTEEENQKSFSEYLTRAQQTSLLDKSIEPINIVYENIVKEGFSLNSKIVESSVDGNHLFIVTDGESLALTWD
ncbi:MAG: Site-specific DNA-methyltransferase (Adenine-specific) [Microgenomates group bacterium GW2011_GWA2_40_6]|nr:MAG: Site-specific DNA-methyltransferase (Adenine-specific) [Microgenomates group bacterium GW2011_GWA2_40_6]